MSKLTVPVGEEDHVLGAPDAPVVLVEYGDYECRKCGQAHPLVQELRDRLGENLCLVFRDFPLTQSHPHALRAAIAAEAAARQGRFWEMHDLLLENQDALEKEDLLDYADELELDRAAFESALEDHGIVERIKEEFRGAVRSGVESTPSFFINGYKYEGDWASGALREDLEGLLAKR